MPEHGEYPLKPKPHKLTRGQLWTVGATVNREDSDTVEDVIVITTSLCMDCGLPHIIKASSTNARPEVITAICAMLITSLLEYDITVHEEPVIYG